MKKFIKDSDYILSEGAAWLEVNDFAIRVYSTDEGAGVDVYRNGDEAGEALALLRLRSHQ